MDKYRTNNVFVPGGLPVATYIPRAERYLEDRLRGAEDNLCKLVTLTGSTKCGKTVLVSRIFPREKVVWLDGGSYQNEEALWADVNDQLNAFTEHQETQTDGTQTGVDGELAGEAGIPLLKVQGKAGAKKGMA